MEIQPPSGMQSEGSRQTPRKEQSNQLQPAEVARRILALSTTQSREGTMLRTIANNITSKRYLPEEMDISKITETQLYLSISTAFTETDAGWPREPYEDARSQLDSEVADRLNGIVRFVDEQRIPHASDEENEVTLKRSFALAEGEVAGVVSIADESADETGRPTDELFLLPLANGGYHTVRFHTWRDEDYNVHREIYDGYPDVAEPSGAELELFIHGEDRNMYDQGIKVVYKLEET